MYHKISAGDPPGVGVLVRGRRGRVLVDFTNPEERFKGEGKWRRLWSQATRG